MPEARVFVTSAVAPSLNVTVPPGVPAPGDTALTVAAKMTDWPEIEGLLDETSETVVSALLTVIVKVVKAARPEARVLVASAVAPSLNVTVPVGVPLPGATALTVAVNVTELLTTEGLSDEVSVLVQLALATVCVNVEDVLTSKLP